MRTWLLPPDIDTDQLAPGHAMKNGGMEVITRKKKKEHQKRRNSVRQETIHYHQTAHIE